MPFCISDELTRILLMKRPQYPVNLYTSFLTVFLRKAYNVDRNLLDLLQMVRNRESSRRASLLRIRSGNYIWLGRPAVCDVQEAYRRRKMYRWKSCSTFQTLLKFPQFENRQYFLADGQVKTHSRRYSIRRWASHDTYVMCFSGSNSPKKMNQLAQKSLWIISSFRIALNIY